MNFTNRRVTYWGSSSNLRHIGRFFCLSFPQTSIQKIVWVCKSFLSFLLSSSVTIFLLSLFIRINSNTLSMFPEFLLRLIFPQEFWYWTNYLLVRRWPATVFIFIRLVWHVYIFCLFLRKYEEMGEQNENIFTKAKPSNKMFCLFLRFSSDR